MSDSLQLFAVPKAFHGRAGILQMNAIGSWRASGARVLLLGNDAGIAECADSLGCQHEPALAFSADGAPLLSDIIRRARSLSTAPWLCYVNADIILTPAFFAMLHTCIKTLNDTEALITTCRINILLTHHVNFASPDWPEKIDRQAERHGALDGPQAIDVFCYNRDLFENIPEFRLGRTAWDNWLLGHAAQKGAQILDASAVSGALHQVHDYGTNGNGWLDVWFGQDAMINRRLMGDVSARLDTVRTGFVTTDGCVADERPPSYPHQSKSVYANRRIKLAMQDQSSHSDQHDGRISNLAYALYEAGFFVPLSGGAMADAPFNLRDTALQVQDRLCQPLIDRVRAATLSRRKVILWGSGGWATRLLTLLERHDIRIDGVIDSDPAKQSQMFGGLKIGSAGSVPGNSENERPFILIGSMAYTEIARILENNGWKIMDDFWG